MSVEVRKPWAPPALESINMRDTAQNAKQPGANEAQCQRSNSPGSGPPGCS